MHLLIDGDMIHYSTGWSIKDGDVEDAYRRVDEWVKWIMEQTDCSDTSLFIGGKGNFRNDILPEYKANRVGKGKPTHHGAIRDYLLDAYKATMVHGEEVDDRLGIIQSREKDTIICSADKDLDCIPGLHFNWSKSKVERGVYNVSLEEADRNFYTQCLVGDSTDNIPGLKKLTGRVATKKLKEPIQTMESRVAMFDYVARCYGDYDWSATAKTLWIRRKEGQIWEPPTSD